MPDSTSAVEVVLDTNVVGAFLFNETNTPLAQQIFSKITAGEVVAYVPSLFWAELQQICYRKTQSSSRNPSPVTLTFAEQQYAVAGRLGLAEFGGELVDYRQTAWDLVRQCGLGSYDAYFLALALDLDVPVWTFDRPFRHALDASPHQGAVQLIGTDFTP